MGAMVSSAGAGGATGPQASNLWPAYVSAFGDPHGLAWCIHLGNHTKQLALWFALFPNYCMIAA
jgi:hypothetical protein